MKLCKDCKHVRMPHPLASLSQYGSVDTIYVPMCGHPKAPRDMVEGRLQTACSNARGEGKFLLAETSALECGPEAKLFEEAPPPPPPPHPEFTAYAPPASERKPSFFKRIFG